MLSLIVVTLVVFTLELFPIEVTALGLLGILLLTGIIGIDEAIAGHQWGTTNMMVYGPGGYRFLDYTRWVAPLNVGSWLLATCLIPWFWPF